MKCAIFEQWTSDIKSIEGVADDEEQISHNQAYLRYLHFAYTTITGGRLYLEVQGQHGFPSDATIIAACLQEAYELAEHGAGEYVLDTKCYGFEN